jgi:hypothetical protein
MAARIVHWIRIAYLAGAWLLLAGVLIQVFLAGLSLFVSRAFWDTHAELGRTLGFLSPILLVLAFLSRLPRATIGLTALLVVLYSLQWTLVVLRRAAPMVAALHAANALFLVWVALSLARRAWALMRATQRTAVIPRQTSEATQSRRAAK